MKWHAHIGRGALSVLAGLLIPLHARGQNLIVNGGFESGYTGFVTGLAYWPVASAGTYSINHPSNAPNTCCWVGCNNHTPGGVQMMLVDGTETVIWQNAAAIAVQPNSAYQFRYWFLTLDTRGRNAAVLRLAINGVVQADDWLGAPPDCIWRSVTHVWASHGANAATISLTDLTGSQDGNDLALDDLELVGVPCLENLMISSPVHECEGLPADFYASASGGGPYSYQWRRNGVNVADQAGRITGSNDAHLRLLAISQADLGTYDCVVSNWCTALPTGTAELTMIPLGCRWAEQGDAGQMPGTAQDTQGVGLIAGITGFVGANDADMYRIYVCNLDEFSASTNNPQTNFDTQLFLFTESGAAVAAHDELPGGAGNHRSRITGACLGGPGTYFLAISAWDKDPVSPAGEMFLDLPFDAEHCADGPGAGALVSGWTAGPPGGNYLINLTGACFNYVVVGCNADFDGDGDIGTDADIQAFFSCVGGNCCPTCGSADFNNDGDIGTDADIESFFSVLGGGPC